MLWSFRNNRKPQAFVFVQNLPCATKNTRKEIISSGPFAHCDTDMYPRYGLPIRRLALDPVCCRWEIKTTVVTRRARGRGRVVVVVRIVEKFVKKKKLSAILRRVRRGGRIISGLTLNPRQRVLHTRPFRCRGPTCVPPSRGSLFALSRVYV